MASSKGAMQPKTSSEHVSVRPSAKVIESHPSKYLNYPSIHPSALTTLRARTVLLLLPLLHLEHDAADARGAVPPLQRQPAPPSIDRSRTINLSLSKKGRGRGKKVFCDRRRSVLNTERDKVDKNRVRAQETCGDLGNCSFATSFQECR